MTHWLFMRETQTSGFMIVCECGEIYKIKTIDKIKIRYKDSKPKTKPVVSPAPEPLVEIEETIPVVEKTEVLEEPEIVPEPIKHIIPDDLLEKTSDTLTNYGFTKTEAKELLSETYSTNPENNPIELIKICLSNITIGDTNGTDNETVSL